MVLENLDTSWYSISGARNLSPLDEIVNEETKKEIMEAIKCGDKGWKISFGWRSEDTTMRKYEEAILRDFSATFDNIGEEGLAQVEAELDEISKATNEARINKLIVMMKQSHDLDVSAIVNLFDEESDKYQGRLNMFDKILEKEWIRFIESLTKVASMKKLIRHDKLLFPKDDMKRSDAEEKEYKQRVAHFVNNVVKKDELCKVALQLVTGNLPPGDKGNRKLVEKIAENATKFKENLMRILAAAHRGLLDLRKKRKGKGKRKKYSGYIDEECGICQKNEADWEDERLKGAIYSENLTFKDARAFHTRFVRSGGMRGLVDQFKSLLDDNPPINLALPKFVANVTHPEKAEDIYKELVNYNCMKLLRDQLHEIDKLMDKDKKQSIFEDDEEEDTCCIFCGRK